MNPEAISFIIILLGVLVALVAALVVFVYREVPKIFKFLKLTRHTGNPLISPVVGGEWNEVATFNPGALLDDDGRVHLVYRTIGTDGMSRFGYAQSCDGFDFTDQSPTPIFAAQSPRYDSNRKMEFDPVAYPSGGSWGGTEDPRIVRIDDRIYVTFSVFDGWDYLRMAFSSISMDDFLNRRWKWTRPVLLSAPNTISKNWVLFPEKINGKFAVIHSIAPSVSVEYIDRLDASVKPIHSPRRDGPQPGRKGHWDSKLRGAGPPPIKTEKGWLLLYHGETAGEPRYKLGAMLLDLNNPEKVLSRSPHPILFSEEWYEHDWKPGVIYASGAVVKDGQLFVYYGGGDKHVCVAHMPLGELLNSLV